MLYSSHYLLLCSSFVPLLFTFVYAVLCVARIGSNHTTKRDQLRSRQKCPHHRLCRYSTSPSSPLPSLPLHLSSLFNYFQHKKVVGRMRPTELSRGHSTVQQSPISPRTTTSMVLISISRTSEKISKLEVLFSLPSSPFFVYFNVFSSF